MAVDKDELIKRAQQWVRAEYYFRLGKAAFNDETMEWYVRAERRLRKALTGYADLEKAFVALGGKAVENKDRQSQVSWLPPTKGKDYDPDKGEYR